MKKLLASLVIVGSLAGCAHGHIDPVIAGAVVGAGVGYIASQPHGGHIHRPVYVPPPHPVYIPPTVYSPAPRVFIPAPPPVIVYPQHRPHPYYRY